MSAGIHVASACHRSGGRSTMSPAPAGRADVGRAGRPAAGRASRRPARRARATCAGGQVRGRAAGVQRGQPQHPACAPRRQAAASSGDVERTVGGRRRSRGQRPRPARRARRRRPRSSPAVRASASATPGPERRLQHRQHLCADPDPRERAGPRCAGPATARGPEPGRPPRCRARRTSSSGRRSSPSTGRHAGQRPGAGAAGQPEQHGLGLVVEGVAEQDDVGAEPLGAPRSSAAYRARRAPPPPARPAVPTSTRTTSTGSSTPSAAQSARRRPPRRAAEPPAGRGRRRPHRRASRLCGPRSTVAAASASESAPPEQATSTRSPGSRSCSGRSGTRGGDRSATTGSRRRPHRARTQPWTRRDPGRRVRDLGRGRQRVSGCVQTALKPSMPTFVDHAADEVRRRRGTAAAWRRGRAAGAASGRAGRRSCGAR